MSRDGAPHQYTPQIPGCLPNRGETLKPPLLPFKLTLFDLLPLECKDCYCLHHREFKHPTTSTALTHLIKKNPHCVLQHSENFKKRAGRNFYSPLRAQDSRLFLMLQDAGWLGRSRARKLVGQRFESSVYPPNDHFSACLSTSIPLYWSPLFLFVRVSGLSKAEPTRFVVFFLFFF